MLDMNDVWFGSMQMMVKMADYLGMMTIPR
jgi:hypothetical protein